MPSGKRISLKFYLVKSQHQHTILTVSLENKLNGVYTTFCSSGGATLSGCGSLLFFSCRTSSILFQTFNHFPHIINQITIGPVLIFQ